MAIFDGKTGMRVVPGTMTPLDLPYSLSLSSLSQTSSDIKPKTKVISGGKKKSFFIEQERTPELLKKWWNVYKSGGLYAQAIDTYAYATFANGYIFEGDETNVQEVEDNFAQFDFDTVGMQGIVHALVLGDGFQEAVGTRGNGNIPVGIVLRDSTTFTIDAEEHGIIKGYIQTIPDQPPIKLKPEQIIHIQLNPSGDVYGISLVGRAFDDIMRDSKTAEASTVAIERHGFKKWHIKVGQPGELIDQEIIKDVSREFQDIVSDNEFTTNADVNIIDIDQGGLEKIEEYSNISLMRVAAALGIPEEALGIRRGSTDATAVARMEFFLKTKISAIQRTVARTYTLNYIDRIVEPGTVKLRFNDVSEEDEFKKAQWIGNLIGSMSRSSEEVLPLVLDIFPKKWIQAQFNIDDTLGMPNYNDTSSKPKKIKPDKTKPIKNEPLSNLE